MELADVINSARHGSHEAFAELYRQFADKIFRYIRLKVPDKQQAEDLLQEVFIKAWKALPQFDVKSGYFSAWLYRIASNATADHYRKVYSHPPAALLDEDLEIGDGRVLDEDVARRMEVEGVRQMLGLLPDQYRQVLELRYVQDYTLQETAGILGKSNLAVRLLQHRALKKFRTLINQQYAALEYSEI